MPTVPLRLFKFLANSWTSKVNSRRNDIIYGELKSGYADNGPAWIGRASYSDSGRTIYFNGHAFQSAKGKGIGANYIDIETGDEYWISGVKKNQQDRHWAGGGVVQIDQEVVDDYLALIGMTELDPKSFEVVSLDKDTHTVKARIYELENE